MVVAVLITRTVGGPTDGPGMRDGEEDDAEELNIEKAAGTSIKSRGGPDMGPAG